MPRIRTFLLTQTAFCVLLVACAQAQHELPFDAETIASFDHPWALAFLPDGRMLVTEKKGRLLIATQGGRKSRAIRGVPEVDYGGQGGLGDVALHPDFKNNRLVYLSYAEQGRSGTRGAAVVRAELIETNNGGYLANTEVIWRQVPKVTGRGHYGHRLLFGDDGYLWISSGERQKFTPAQELQSNLGKIIRLFDDGSIPEDNPFVNDDNARAEIWSLGHRNPLGIAFDKEGQLWNIEMGPRGGDELNRVERAGNYGYPVVSNGDHYSGKDIPDHDTHPEFIEPAVWWTPVISPADLMIYTGKLFGDWQGNAFAAGLSSRAIIRIEIDGEIARELERFDMNARIRSVVQGPQGALWVLEDDRGDSKGRLLKLTPKD